MFKRGWIIRIYFILIDEDILNNINHPNLTSGHYDKVFLHFLYLLITLAAAFSIWLILSNTDYVYVHKMLWLLSVFQNSHYFLLSCSQGSCACSDKWTQPLSFCSATFLRRLHCSILDNPKTCWHLAHNDYNLLIFFLSNQKYRFKNHKKTPRYSLLNG